MLLPMLTHWEPTCDSLHRAAQVLGLIRKAQVMKQPNALHLALFVTGDGLTTGPLKNGACLDLRFASAEVRGQTGAGRAFALPLEGQTSGALLEALLAALGIERAAFGETELSPMPLAVNLRDAAGYCDALNAAYSGLARFRARLAGTMTPLVVWPHGFDLSGLWFAGGNPDEQSQPHVNFGFSPGSPGLPRPYLYAYASPWPGGVENGPLPPLARWYTEGWKGAVLAYDDLRTIANPVQTVEEIALAFFTALTAG